MDLDKLKKYLSEKYEFANLIGEGGFAEVYLAKDKMLEREVAIKILSSSYSNDKDIIERFHREAKLYAKLEHKNLIPIYDIGIKDGGAFIVMKYIKGKSLKLILKERKEISIHIITKIMREMSEVLQYIHSRGIIHRDIKPANIIIEEGTERAYLADFGIAHSESNKTMTQSGSIMGTPFYISPEQIKGEKVDHRSDIYAFGTTIYELITREHLFDGNSSIEILYKHVNEKPRGIEDLVPNLPRVLAYIVSKCVEKNPDDRFQRADEIPKFLKQDDNILSKDKLKSTKTKTKVHFLRRFLISLSIFIVIIIALHFINKIKEKENLDLNVSTIYNKKKADKSLVEDKNIGKSKTEKDESVKETVSKQKDLSQVKNTNNEELKKNIENLKVKKEIKVKPTDTEKTIELISPGAPGTVKFSSSYAADVYLNEKKIGNTTQIFYKDFKPGKYIFKFVIPDYMSFESEIEVKPDKVVVLHQKFKPYGLVNINASPFAKVLIDGIDSGDTPIIKKKISYGKHKIELVKKGYKTIVEIIDVERKKKKNKYYKLEKEEISGD